jgi:hypothetical protein
MHHLYILAMGLLFCLSVVVIPLLVGLPCELFLIHKIKKQIELARAWLIGSFILAGLAIIYGLGAIIVS